MGKTRLIRISNRGIFPRWRLESVGSSSKRDKMDDKEQGGWFGSGTKIAPIAAMALGMEVWIASSDGRGPYLVTYDVVDGPGGKEDPRVRMKYSGTETYEVVTQFSPDGFMNWSKPIGDDLLKEFRVWREPFRNARDADHEAPKVHGCESVGIAPPGESRVYVTRTKEFDHLWKHLNRYFKYLSKDVPVYEVPGIGRVWPKSEDQVTRMFSLGTMALCSKSSGWSTLYDYDFDEKTLMSEERTFENMGRVYVELARLLAACPNVILARELLRGMVEGKCELERIALGQLNAFSKIPSKAIWKAAWHALYGAEAVLQVGNWSDEHARVSFRKKPVHVNSATLRGFLKLCGVQTSTEIIPAVEQSGLRVIPREQLAFGERAILDEARRLLLKRYPDMKDIPVRVFEPLTQALDQAMNGFCQPNEPPFKEVYVKRSLMLPHEADEDVERRLWRTLKTLNHEYRHVRSGARDGTSELMKQADADHADLVILLRAAEVSDEEEIELDWSDIWEGDTDPGQSE